MEYLETHNPAFLNMAVGNLHSLYNFCSLDKSKEDSMMTGLAIAYNEYVRWYFDDEIPKTLKDNLLPKPTPSIF